MNDDGALVDLTVRFCHGQENDLGSRYPSCVYIDAHLEVVDNPDAISLSIAPFRRREKQGSNALFIPVAMPEINAKAA